MPKKFKTLRLVALLYKILAWVILIGGILLALFAVIVGALQGRAGIPSPLLADVPVLSQLSGLLSGLILGVIILLFALVQFVFVYASSEVIHLGLAVESNTQKTAHYLSGEDTIPPPPMPVSRDVSDEPSIPDA